MEEWDISSLCDAVVGRTCFHRPKYIVVSSLELGRVRYPMKDCVVIRVVHNDSSSQM